MTEVERITDINRIQFPKLGIDFHIDPTAFSIGSLTIQWYGIIIVVGLLLAVIYCVPRMKRFGIDSDKAIDAVIGGVIGGIIGARIYYIAFNFDEYKKESFGQTIKAMVNTREGGLAIYGGLIGAVLVGLIICHIKDIRKLPMLDVVVIGFLLGQGIGRWGNLVNQEAFGTNTDSIFGMTGGRIQYAIINSSSYLDGTLAQKGIELSEKYAVHPCFLYESAWCLLGFVLLSLWAKHRKYDGQLLLMYLAWYGMERFIVEGLRTDSLMLGNIRISQALSALLVITSVILQIIMFFRVRRDPDRYKLYANTGEARLQLEQTRRKKVVISPADSAVLDGGFDEIGILPDEDEEPVSSIIDDADEEIEEKAEEIRDKVKDAAEAVKDKAEDTAEAVKDKVKDAVEAAKDKAKDAAEAVRDKAEDAAEAVKDKAENAAEAVRDKAKDAVEAVQDTAEDAGEVLTGVVEGVIEDAEDRIEEFSEDIGDAVTAVEEEAEEIADKAEDIKDKAEDAAEEAAEKAEDIAEEAEKTADAVKEKAEDIRDNTEDKYDHLAEKHDEKLTGGSGKKNSKKKKRRR
ncbi:MAG: prolipoprotein diacylglyceryl transferase [Ruminococcus sp.]|nr:prolipoprotein diacylglyceryl transferase [Ruminococcus sp.]